jgi:hypothetical protein
MPFQPDPLAASAYAISRPSSENDSPPSAIVPSGDRVFGSIRTSGAWSSARAL